MSDTQVLFYLNDNLVEVLGLTNAATGAFIDSATVTCSLVDSAGSPVTGATNISLITLGSGGDYRGTIPDTASIERSDTYVAQITADGGAGLMGYWEIDAQSIVRYTSNTPV